MRKTMLLADRDTVCGCSGGHGKDFRGYPFAAQWVIGVLDCLVL